MVFIVLFLAHALTFECSKVELTQVKIPTNCGTSMALKPIPNESHKVDPNCYAEYKVDGKIEKIFFHIPMISSISHLDYTPSCSGIDLDAKGSLDGLRLTGNCRIILNFTDLKDCICARGYCRDFESPRIKPKSDPIPKTIQ